MMRLVVLAAMVVAALSSPVAAQQSFTLLRADGAAVSDDVFKSEMKTCVQASEAEEPGALGAWKGQDNEQAIARAMATPEGWRVTMAQMAATARMMARAMDCLNARGYPAVVGR